MANLIPGMSNMPRPARRVTTAKLPRQEAEEVTILAAQVDSGNSAFRTSFMRPGMVLVEHTDGSGKYVVGTDTNAKHQTQAAVATLITNPGSGGWDGTVRAWDVAQLVRVRVNMDEGFSRVIRRDQGVAVRRRFAEACADGKDQVGRLDPVSQFGIGAIAQIARPDGAVVRNGILPAKPGSNGDAVRRRKFRKVSRGIIVPSCTTNDRDGRLGRRYERCERLHCSSVGRLCRAVDTRPVNSLRHFDQHVLRKCDHNRSRPAGHRDGICAGNIFRDTGRIVDPRCPFGKWREHRREIDFLKSFPVPHATIHIPNEQDHRLRILHRHMNADAGIGGSRPAGHKGNARPPGQGAVGTGHISDAALLPADDGLDFGRIVQRVEHGKKALARNGEDAVAALDDKLVNKNTSAGARVAHAW